MQVTFQNKRTLEKAEFSLAADNPTEAAAASIGMSAWNEASA
jgi:hypothetical protein